MLLNQVIDPQVLQKAVDHLYGRFPMFFVSLRNGVFWHYFDSNTRKFLVEEERDYPCCKINPKLNNGYLLRILYGMQRISVEVFHSLTDGAGAVEFCKSLLYYYLTFLGHSIRLDKQILLQEDRVPKEELEDSFAAYDQQVWTRPEKMAKSFWLKGTTYKPRGVQVISGVLSASKVHAVAKAKGATITSYLTAVLIQSIARTSEGRKNNPIVVCIPVNLRSMFPSKTLRNFFSIVNVGVQGAGAMSLDGLIQQVSGLLKEKTTKENLQQGISNNVRLEKSLVSKIIPLPLKNIFLGLGFAWLGEDKKTITLSNLGRIALPQDMEPLVLYMETILYPTPKSPINCGVCSVNDRLVISFAKSIVETDCIQAFFSFLAQEQALDVLVYGNDWGCPGDGHRM